MGRHMKVLLWIIFLWRYDDFSCNGCWFAVFFLCADRDGVHAGNQINVISELSLVIDGYCFPFNGDGCALLSDAFDLEFRIVGCDVGGRSKEGELWCGDHGIEKVGEITETA